METLLKYITVYNKLSFLILEIQTKIKTYHFFQEIEMPKFCKFFKCKKIR